MLRRLALASALAVASALAACGGSGERGGEHVGQVAEPLAAQCAAKVSGVGTLDVETEYLPNVVHCENGGAPYEALKAQAVAARTFLYYKLETSGSIADGQGDQVYSCGSQATAQQKQAVLDTAGVVLRSSGTTICSFYVAGGPASPPSCHGGSASTEGYVTYNAGLRGASVRQSTLGVVSATNDRNRGCMSQLGARCLASDGKKYDDILRFYYGDDIVLERATGACVPQAEPAPTTTPPATTAPRVTDAGTEPDRASPAVSHSGDAGDLDPGADPASPSAASDPLIGARGSRALAGAARCSASPGARAAAPAWLVLGALVLGALVFAGRRAACDGARRGRDFG